MRNVRVIDPESSLEGGSVNIHFKQQQNEFPFHIE